MCHCLSRLHSVMWCGGTVYIQGGGCQCVIVGVGYTVLCGAAEQSILREWGVSVSLSE